MLKQTAALLFLTCCSLISTQLAASTITWITPVTATETGPGHGSGPFSYSYDAGGSFTLSSAGEVQLTADAGLEFIGSICGDISCGSPALDMTGSFQAVAGIFGTDGGFSVPLSGSFSVPYACDDCVTDGGASDTETATVFLQAGTYDVGIDGNYSEDNYGQWNGGLNVTSSVTVTSTLAPEPRLTTYCCSI